MGVHFFTTQPFTVNVQGKSYSLTKCEKIWIVIAGIAGLALLGIGAIFTFYGMSYLLRKRAFKEISNNHAKVLKKLNKDILLTFKDLESVDKIKSIEYSAIFYHKSNSLLINSKSNALPKYYEKMTAAQGQSLQDMLKLAIEASFKNAKQNNKQNFLDITVQWKVVINIECEHFSLLKGSWNF